MKTKMAARPDGCNGEIHMLPTAVNYWRAGETTHGKCIAGRLKEEVEGVMLVEKVKLGSRSNVRE